MRILKLSPNWPSREPPSIFQQTRSEVCLVVCGWAKRNAAGKNFGEKKQKKKKKKKKIPLISFTWNFFWLSLDLVLSLSIFFFANTTGVESKME